MSAVPFLFVGLGGVLLLAAWAVWFQGRHTRNCVRDLLALPENTHPMEWPEQARMVLQRAGIGGMAWAGQWFGDPVRGQWGSDAGPGAKDMILDAGPDCRVELNWAGLSHANEASALALLVVDVFVQSWVSRMRQRTQAVAVALSQRAHLHLYWQHDMRNLAQWVGLMADEFGSAHPDQLPRLAQRLQQQAPVVLARVQKLLAETDRGNPFPDAFNASPVPQDGTRSVLALVADAVSLAGLTLHRLDGVDQGGVGVDPQVAPLQAHALERAMDNILSNIARDGAVRVGEAGLRLNWLVVGDQFQGQLFTPNLSVPLPKRPFEPMQTATGSGLGLYQARRSLRDAGGELGVRLSPDGPVFEWCVTVCPQRQKF
jgi:hypothetical protein